MTEKQNKKCGVITICGAPNAGKSTLTNKLIGRKVSIISDKPQTTRTRLRGILTKGNTQLVFIDTPGIFKPIGKIDNKLNRSIVETAKNSFDGADYVIFVFDVTKNFNTGTEKIIEQVKSLNAKSILVINKIDLVEKPKLLEVTMELNKFHQFDETFMLSSLKNQGTEDLLTYLINNAPEGFFLYPEDYITDQQSRFYAAEITREKLFNKLRQEIPYGIMIQTEKYEETKKLINIHQTIICTTEDHKKIIIGKSGSMLKNIGKASRLELEKAFEKKVNLYLFVKVRKNWLENKESYIEQNIDFSN